MENSKPQSVVQLFLRLYKEDVASRNYKDMFPWCLCLCLVAGVFFGLSLSIPLPRDKPNLVAIFAALVTAQGVLLALSVSSMQQVYITISSGVFALYLKRNDLLDGYMYLIKFQQATSITSLLLLVLALFCVYLSDNLNVFFNALFDNIGGFNNVVLFALCCSLGVFFYSLKQTSDSFKMASDLTHYKSTFDALNSAN